VYYVKTDICSLLYCIQAYFTEREVSVLAEIYCCLLSCQEQLHFCTTARRVMQNLFWSNLMR